MSTQAPETAAHDGKPAPSSHCFLVPYRMREGRKYAYNYHVYEYDPATCTIGAQLITSSDPEFDVSRILKDKGITGELYFWRNFNNWYIKIKDITTAAQKRIEETESTGPKVSKKHEMTEEKREKFNALS